MVRFLFILTSIFLLSCSSPVSSNKGNGSGTEEEYVRSTNLGISGPDLNTIGKGINFLKTNSAIDSATIKYGLLPVLSPLFNVQMRDVSISLGNDGYYYLTGSTGDDIWIFNDGIELWKSADLKNWTYLGLVWSFEKDGTWQKEWRQHKGQKCRSIWAPELCYIKDNYYLTYSIPPGDRGILRSTSGKPEGPFVNALENDGKLEGNLDASLFEDTDGSIYMVYGGGWIVKMKDDLSGIAEKPIKPILINPDLNPAHHSATCAPRRNCEDVGREGAFLFKENGIYYLSVADTYEGRYSSMIAVSDNIYGPYRNRQEAIPGGGGGNFFKDKSGEWHVSIFGNDNQMPWREMPAISTVELSDSTVKVKL